MARHTCTKRAWSVTALVLLTFLTAFVLVVVHRNAGAARARRAAPTLMVLDYNPSPEIFTTKRLPTNKKLMCSIGNGHVATNVFSTTVYMNGLYNGAQGESHRARVPAWANVRLNSTLEDLGSSPTYGLDTAAGVFTVHVDREWSVVEQRIYAHRFYSRAIVNQIVIKAKQKADIWRDHHARYVQLSFLPGPASEDIDFEEPSVLKIAGQVVMTSCGKTKVVEDPHYQEAPSEVCAFWTYVPQHLTVPRRGKFLHTFVMTLDTKREVALKEITDVLQETEDELFAKHTAAWKDLNAVGKIEIGGNIPLAKTVNAIWYYLLSSLPSYSTNQPQGLFYGLSPGGLARGGLFDDYEGHNFWDTELWMFPGILMLHPQHASSLLRYRIAMATAAADLAIQNHNQGIKYPWESAFTGREVVQPCCPEVAEFQHHITGCIAFAARQYVAVTGDEQWLRNGGCAFILEMADFWYSRAQYNETSGYYDIHNVMGPDEDHSNVTNSVFTNVVAGLAMFMGQYTTCLCNVPNEARARRWAEMAARLALPYDSRLDYHPQFSGYERKERIKQADVVLLGFPLQYFMNQSTKSNDLAYYETVTRESGPAMTWSMHSIGHLRLGEPTEAERLFNKSYKGYVREPFKIWTEYQKPRVGAVNFLTGMGGFLQTIMFGYAGLSIHLDKLEIIRPQVPPQSTRLKIPGIKFLGTEFTLDIHPSNASIKVTQADVNRTLIVLIKNNKIPLSNGNTVVLYGEGPFEIRRDSPNKCPLPLDLIGKYRFKANETEL